MLLFNAKFNPSFSTHVNTGAALALVSSLFMTSTALADCNDLSAQFSALESLADLVCTEASNGDGWAAESCGDWEHLGESTIPELAVETWNILAGNGSLTFGPRSINPGIPERGNVRESTQRVFILSAVADNEINIDLDYIRGRAGLDLDICALDADGDPELIARFSDDRGDQQGLNETVTLQRGSVIIFKLKPFGNTLNSYKYVFDVTLNNLPSTGSGNHPVTTLEPNINRPGGDYRNFPIGFVQPRMRKSSVSSITSAIALQPVNQRWECRRACRDDSQCRAWTFVKATATQPAHCWLKDTVPSPISDSCCDSGVRN